MVRVAMSSLVSNWPNSLVQHIQVAFLENGPLQSTTAKENSVTFIKALVCVESEEG